MIAVIIVIFFALVGFIFWLGLWGDKKKEGQPPVEAEAAIGDELTIKHNSGRERCKENQLESFA